MCSLRQSNWGKPGNQIYRFCHSYAKPAWPFNLSCKLQGIFQHAELVGTTLELFFGLIRTHGGHNVNPTTKQFHAAFKKVIVQNELSDAPTANCLLLVNINILTICAAKASSTLIDASLSKENGVFIHRNAQFCPWKHRKWSIFHHSPFENHTLQHGLLGLEWKATFLAWFPAKNNPSVLLKTRVKSKRPNHAVSVAGNQHMTEGWLLTKAWELPVASSADNSGHGVMTCIDYNITPRLLQWSWQWQTVFENSAHWTNSPRDGKKNVVKHEELSQLSAVADHSVQVDTAQ